MRYARDYCDALRDCEFMKFDTQEEYQMCVDMANTTVEDCQSECTSRGDPTEANDAHNTCIGTFEPLTFGMGCQNVYWDALNNCGITQGNCVALCAGGDTMCIDACNAAFSNCIIAPGIAVTSCVKNCDAVQTKAIAALALDIDQKCLATCCSTKDTNPTVCEAPCIEEFTKSIVDAESKLADCNVPCWSYDEDTEQPVFDETCGNGCKAEYDGALADAGKKYLECIYPCLGDERCPFPPFYPIYIGTFEELPVFSMTADGSITTSACALKFSKTYTDSFSTCLSDSDSGGTPSDETTCINEANLALNRSILECCWNIRGRSLYEDQLDMCGQTFSRCNNTANITCPQPGTGIGEPCFDPTSEECMTATSNWHECLDPALATCDTAKDACVSAIIDTARCDGCPVGNAP